MSEPLWFFAGIAYVRVSRNDTGDRFSILELEGPPGDTPPLHVHHTEDEVFHILEGSARFHIGSEVRDGSSGDFVLVPKGTPHTFIVGDEAARWLVITSPGDFERFVLAVGRPAEAPGFPPPPPGPPPAEELERINSLAAEHGIEILGPPGALPG